MLLMLNMLLMLLMLPIMPILLILPISLMLLMFSPCGPPLWFIIGPPPIMPPNMSSIMGMKHAFISIGPHIVSLRGPGAGHKVARGVSHPPIVAMLATSSPPVTLPSSPDLSTPQQPELITQLANSSLAAQTASVVFAGSMWVVQQLNKMVSVHAAVVVVVVTSSLARRSVSVSAQPRRVAASRAPPARSTALDHIDMPKAGGEQRNPPNQAA
mmetsp:Transcript_8390/g.15302  ORF Transcript_8390/g.15302 Transcript_8390/m.15302 type:complete len:213 (-) Transcript_8390:1-639(-)